MHLHTRIDVESKGSLLQTQNTLSLPYFEPSGMWKILYLVGGLSANSVKNTQIVILQAVKDNVANIKAFLHAKLMPRTKNMHTSHNILTFSGAS